MFHVSVQVEPAHEQNKRFARYVSESLIVLVAMNSVWSMEFTHDQLDGGR
jgi:hypothetical protein